jgi:hypothetical protein
MDKAMKERVATTRYATELENNSVVSGQLSLTRAPFAINNAILRVLTCLVSEYRDCSDPITCEKVWLKCANLFCSQNWQVRATRCSVSSTSSRTSISRNLGPEMARTMATKAEESLDETSSITTPLSCVTGKRLRCGTFSCYTVHIVCLNSVGRGPSICEHGGKAPGNHPARIQGRIQRVSPPPTGATGENQNWLIILGFLRLGSHVLLGIADLNAAGAVCPQPHRVVEASVSCAYQHAVETTNP